MKKTIVVAMVVVVLSGAEGGDFIAEGNKAYRKGEYERAVKCYLKALEKGAAPSVYLNLGHAYFRLGRWDTALDAYVRSGLPEAWKWIASCHVSNERWKEAEHALLSYISRFPSDSSAREMLAFVYSRSGCHSAAADVYRMLAREGSPRFYVLLARELVADGRKEEALDALEAAMLLGDRSSSVLRLLGDLYLQKEMYREAADCFSRLFSGTSDVDDCFRAGYAYFMSGDYASARRFFCEVVKRDPSNAKAYFFLGRLAVMEEKSKEAVRNLRMAVEKDPHFVSAYVALADYLMKRKDFAGAASALEKAVKGGEESVSVFYNCVVSFMRCGKKEDALKVLKRGLRVHPLDSRLMDLVKVMEEKEFRE